MLVRLAVVKALKLSMHRLHLGWGQQRRLTELKGLEIHPRQGLYLHGNAQRLIQACPALTSP